jgi:hypothetical protein
MAIAVLVWIAVLDTVGLAFALYGYFSAKRWGR